MNHRILANLTARELFPSSLLFPSDLVLNRDVLYARYLPHSEDMCSVGLELQTNSHSRKVHEISKLL